MDYMTEVYKWQGCRKDWMGTLVTRTWDYGLMAPGYVLVTWIQSQGSQVAHQRARTRQSWEAKIPHWQECGWHLQCHEETRWQECQWNALQKAISFSHISGEPEASCLPILSLWRCTFDWDVKGEHEDTVHLLEGQKRLEDSSKTWTCCLRSIRPMWQGWWRPSKSTLDHIIVL